MLVDEPPLGEGHLVLQPLNLLIPDNHKLLVGGRVDIKIVTTFLKHLLHLHCLVNGIAGKVKIEVVGEERVKLHTYQSAFGQECPMLFLDAEEMSVGIVMGEDNSLTAECTHLGAADIEHVAELCQFCHRYLTSFGHQSVAQTGTIDIKRDVKALAYAVDIFKLLATVDRAEFCGEGDIHQSGIDTVGVVAVVDKII